MESKKSSTRFELGCALMFVAPFVLAGVGALGYGLFELLGGASDARQLLPMLGVGALFTAIGGSFLAAILMGHHRESQFQRRQAEMPDAPWRWREDWAAGRIRGNLPAGMFFFWLSGVIFGGAGLIVLLNLKELVREGALGYVFLLFPLLGVALLVTAIYRTLRWMKYGRSECQLIVNPAIPGGAFEAIVRAKIDLAPEDVVTATLTCFHCYITGTGKNCQSHRDVQWRESTSVPREEITREADGTAVIPITFPLEVGCDTSTPGSPSDRIEWELSVHATVVGIDFGAAFVVPVFHVPEADASGRNNVE